MKKIVLLSAFVAMLMLIGCSHQESNLEDTISSVDAEMLRMSPLNPTRPSLDSLLLSDDSCRSILFRNYRQIYPGMKNLSKAELTVLHTADFSESLLSVAYSIGLMSHKDSLAYENDSLTVPNATFYLYSMPGNRFALVRPYRGAFRVLTYIEGYENVSTDLLTNYASYATSVMDVADTVVLESEDIKYNSIHHKIAAVHGLGKEDLISFVDYTEMMLAQMKEFEDVIYGGGPDIEYFDVVVTCDIANRQFTWSQIAPYNAYLADNSLVGSAALCIAKLLLYEYNSFDIGNDHYSCNGTQAITSPGVLGQIFAGIHRETSTTPSALFPVTTNLAGLAFLGSQGFQLTIMPRTASESSKTNFVLNEIQNNHPVIAIKGNSWCLIYGYIRRGSTGETIWLINNGSVLGDSSTTRENLHDYQLVSYVADNEIHF